MSRIRKIKEGAVRGSTTSAVSQLGIQRVFAPLAILLAFTVLGYLLWVTLRTPLETGLHVVRMEQLEAVNTADRQLNRAIVRAPLQLESEPLAMLAAAERFDEQSRQIGFGQAGLKGQAPLVDRALNDFLRSTKAKLDALEPYQETLRRLRLLFAAMRSGGVSVLSAPAIESEAALGRDIKRLIREATQYSIISTAENAELLDQLSASIAVQASALEDTEALAALSQLLDTVDGLRFTRDELNQQLDEIAEAGAAGALATLKTRYENHFSQLQAAADRNRQTLAVYAAALLLAFGLIAWRLRGSFQELDQVNMELQDANINLEGIVAERTRDLSTALEDLRLQQAQLIQSEKMASLGQMVAGVAHEINTPLGYANSNVSIVRELVSSMEDVIDEESRGEFDMLLGDAQYGLEQIAELVMSLKNFSRVDRSQTELFDLNEGIETSLKICQNQIKDLDVQRDFGELPDISCAPSQLNQVFLNLINNAAQAMDGKGTLTLSTAVDGDNAVVRVRDSGCGMDAETAAHIFEPFFTTKPVGEGTGLGLSIVFRIIEDHGGRISVESEPGVGTEFVVSLPIAGKAVPEQAVVTEDSIILSDSAV
ncbi:MULTISPECIES: sensor histidine kinase [Spongiibacter]|uniref:sensor histidine kinase n=2 Tax=Spongiibacteraceae TaxID=1706375 RepID=UPI00257FB7D2|nr:ATP-binding protein [Spongiibacter sp. UBA1325]|tara:strand:+ start:1954 stop:3747 length:1794 start_codon:yes stop_codon:yes gene_type:complete